MKIARLDFEDKVVQFVFRNLRMDVEFHDLEDLQTLVGMAIERVGECEDNGISVETS